METRPVTGVTSYQGLTSQQHYDFIEPFKTFLPQIKPNRILEIGTAGGGTILSIYDVLKENNIDCPIRSYEIYDRDYYKILLDVDIDVRIQNIFDEAYLNFSDTNTSEVEDVINYVKQPGTTLIMCDGGHKIAEFNLFSDIMKPGDFIMAHDFAWTWEIFKNEIEHKIWDWAEITGENVAEAIARNNLEPYMKDEFQAVAWGCMRKP